MINNMQNIRGSHLVAGPAAEVARLVGLETGDRAIAVSADRLQKG